MAEKSKMMFISVFTLLTAITAVIVLMANVGFFGAEVRQSEFSKWGMGAVLGEIVVVTIAAFRWEVLTPRNMLFTFDLKSPLMTGTILTECSYEIQNEIGSTIDKRDNIRIVRNKNGYYSCFIPLPSGVRYEHTIMMKLKDSQQKEYPVTDWVLQRTMEV
jgi:hypothetical protein